MDKQKTAYSIHAIEVLEDNIIWLLILEDKAIVIDPAITNPVKEWLLARKINLIAILQTHHHHDHIGGSQGLLDEWPNAEIIASSKDKERIPFQTISVKDKDTIEILGTKIHIIEVKGHTKAHIAYYIPPIKDRLNQPILFCGDSLFGAGCGRIFEGSYEDMYKSLIRLNNLPGDTEVYCAHEYTEANLEWAQSIEPENNAIKERLSLLIKNKNNENFLSIPSTIKLERETNLFLRANDLNKFRRLRESKDHWKG